MSLLIAIGYNAVGAKAQPSLVYLGRLSSEMADALEKTDAVRVDIIRNPPAVRKSNARAYANVLRGVVSQPSLAPVVVAAPPAKPLSKREQAAADKAAAKAAKAAANPPSVAPNSPAQGESSQTPPPTPPAEPPPAADDASEEDDEGKDHFGG